MTNETKDLMPLSRLTDEELVNHVYLSKELRSALELELTARLQQLLDNVEDAGVGPTIDEFVDRFLNNQE